MVVIYFFLFFFAFQHENMHVSDFLLFLFV